MAKRDVEKAVVQAQTESPSRKVSKWIDEQSSIIVERPASDASEPATSVNWREYKAPY